MPTLPGMEHLDPTVCPRGCDDGFLPTPDGAAVYPCQHCRPEAFTTWAGGHYDPKHDAESCSDCLARRGGSRLPNPSTSPRRVLT